MNFSKKIFIVGLILILGLSACNLPSQEPGTGTPETEIAETATALALTFIAQSSQPAATELPSSTPFPTDTPTITPTYTPTVPMARVSVDTNCRTGPGIIYDRVGGLLVGEEAVVIGKYTIDNYWIINNPDSSGTCWLWGQYATISGNTAGLPEYTPPPTPTPTFTSTPSPPTAPVNISVSKACTPLVVPQYLLAAIISWEDKSNDETGFRVYRDGVLLTTVNPNVTTLNDSLPINMGVALTYSVEAVNATGASASITATAVTCP